MSQAVGLSCNTRLERQVFYMVQSREVAYILIHICSIQVSFAFFNTNHMKVCGIKNNTLARDQFPVENCEI